MDARAEPDGENSSSTVAYTIDPASKDIALFTAQLQPFISTVQELLHRGTITIICLGVACNIISFVVLTRKNMRRVTPNLYLAVLAICDSLALIMNFMVGVLRGQHISVNQTFQGSEGLCKIHSVIVELFNLLSVWIIVAFTAERFVMIRFPLKARAIISRRNTMIVIACVIVFAVAFSFHKMIVSGFEGDSVFGYAACRTTRAILPGIIYFYVAFNTWFPTIVIAILNALIILKVRATNAKRQEMTSISSRSRSEDKVLRILLTVSSTYVFLMLPLGIVQTIELTWNTVAKVPPTDPGYVDFMTTKITLKWVRAFFFFFYQLNFAVNFFLYAFSTAGTKFRATLRRVLGVKGGTVADTTFVDEEGKSEVRKTETRTETIENNGQKDGETQETNNQESNNQESNNQEAGGSSQKKVVINEANNESRA